MNRTGFIALLVGAITLYAFFHFVFQVEAFTLFYIFLVKLLAFAKGFIARLSWEAVFLFSAHFFKRAVVKFAFIQIPMTLGIPFLTVLLLKPQTKRRWRIRLEWFKRRATRGYRRVRNWFDGIFGVNGLLAFILSCVVAVATLAYSMYFIGFEFFIWVGTWGPIGRFFGWLWGWITYFGGFLRNAIYRLPKVGLIIVFFSNIWKEHIAPRIPFVEWYRKRFVNKSLRAARNSREHSMRVYWRWARRIERRQVRRREARYRRLGIPVNEPPVLKTPASCALEESVPKHSGQ